MSSMGTFQRGYRWAAAVVASVGLAACSSSIGGVETVEPTVLPPVAPVDGLSVQILEQSEPGSFSDAQRAELADGVVTYDEYQAAFQRMNACIEADGYELLIEPEVNQMIQARIPDAAFPSYQRCYDPEFSMVDATWQIYREDFGADTQALAECLVARGEEPALTWVGRYQQFAALGLDPMTDCEGVTGNG
jgi:hypothetical protein